MKTFDGQGVSPGIGIAKALLLRTEAVRVERTTIQDANAEVQRFIDTVDAVVKQTMELAQSAKQTMGEDKAAIFEAHAMILQDPELTQGVVDRIREDKVDAAYASQLVLDGLIANFEAMDDEYFRERAADMRDIQQRLLRAFLGIATQDISKLDEDHILVAKDLTPSDTARMDKRHILGILTEIGGSTAHMAIMARTLEIPAVSGIPDVLQCVQDGELIALDGDSGKVYVQPSGEILAAYRAKKASQEQTKARLEFFRGKPSVSADGRSFELAGNIGTVADVERVLEGDGEAVGLFRTEFLYLDRQGLPDEQEQFEAYKAVAEAMDGHPVVIRTLDVGGDKELPALALEKEANPFLGYRAIRICIDREDLFLTQLRAILRASVFGELRIMFPMIGGLYELRAAKGFVEKAKAQLKAEKIKFDENIQVGIMVEIPSAAIQADQLAKECDFFSIGTNDLTQYTLAVDRGNANVATLYSAYHPAVLRLIHRTIRCAHVEGIWVGMCGEAAGDATLIPLLMAMGLDEFSMRPNAILRARQQMARTHIGEQREKLLAALDLDTAEDVRAYLESLYNKKDED